MKWINRWRMGTAIILGGLLLAGCGASGNKQSASDTTKSVWSTHVKKSTKKDKTTPTVVHKSATKKATASSKQATTPWDTTRDKQLEEYMIQFGQTMGQSYKKYDGVHPLTASVGVTYPTSLANELVDGAKTAIAWRPDGTGDNTYNVVAIYNHDGTTPPLPNRITYFFAFHDGQPVVLVDQTRDGDPTAVVTQNADLKQHFAAIAAGKGKAVTRPVGNAQVEPIRDLKQVGLMVHELVWPDDDVTKEMMIGVYKNENRYYVGNGTSVSTCGFLVTGDTVDYWVKDASTGLPTYQQDYLQYRTTIQALTAKFGATPAQRQALQATANRMDAIEDMTE